MSPLLRMPYICQRLSPVIWIRLNGTYLKAPNGADTNHNPEQWAIVRTKKFKAWFGDWEKTFRLKKLKNSTPLIASGNGYQGKYELNRDSA